jgi:hypothetical protein
MRSEVFPDPVGPMMRLMRPRSKINSASILKTKWRFEGVSEPSVSLDHAKLVSRNPILSELKLSSESKFIGPFSAKESKSSVLKIALILTSVQKRGTHIMEEVIHSIQGDLACDSLGDCIQNHVELVPKHIEDSYGTEDFGST